jgi:diguanylate cyclase (GGDEF)-like protein/PAS domain S-box-containing protein
VSVCLSSVNLTLPIPLIRSLNLNSDCLTADRVLDTSPALQLFPVTNLRRLGRLPALPAPTVARVQLLFLVLASGAALVTIPSIMGGHAAVGWRLAGTLAAAALPVYWIVGYRRGGFSIALEPLEAAALFLVLRASPGNPVLPLFGLLFRSLYGGFALAMTRYGLWIAALFLAHDSRGAIEQQADIARALGTGVAPPVMQALRVACERSERSERRLASLIQNSTDIVTVVGADLMIRWQADSIRNVLGHDPQPLLGTPILDLVHEQDRAVLSDYFAEAQGAPGMSRTLMARLRDADGSYRHFDLVAANRLHDPSVAGFVLNMRDVSDAWELERELRELAAKREHEAMHDPLTGLANRRLLSVRLDHALAKAHAQERELTVMLIDLNRFKELNDTLGHAAGDQLLREIRPRLIEATSGAELVARIGGDEFAVILAPGRGAADAERIAERLRVALEEPFDVQGLTLRVGASVGIAVYPEQADSADTLLQRADVAMYSAKKHGVGHELYDAAYDGHSRQRLALIGELPAAIASGQLVVHYQPKYDLQDGTIRGVEALVRWQHPVHGLLGPDKFVALAEHAGVMRALTHAVLDEALAQCASWRAEGIDLCVAVNLSAPNLLDDGFPLNVRSLLAKWQVPVASLQLEITETIVSNDRASMIDVLRQLRGLGVTLSLDDFGVGSSSLSFLRHLPVHELKIDQSFIFDLDADDHNAAVVRTIIDLAHNLDMRVVAEGIETEAIRDRLAGYGCDEGQGFLLGRPMPASQLTAVVRDVVGRHATRLTPTARRAGTRALTSPHVRGKVTGT